MIYAKFPITTAKVRSISRFLLDLSTCWILVVNNAMCDQSISNDVHKSTYPLYGQNLIFIILSSVMDVSVIRRWVTRTSKSILECFWLKYLLGTFQQWNQFETAAIAQAQKCHCDGFVSNFIIIQLNKADSQFSNKAQWTYQSSRECVYDRWSFWNTTLYTVISSPFWCHQLFSSNKLFPHFCCI